jgi:hypothetical protein
MARAMPTAMFASARDFEGDRVATKDTLQRIDDAVTQLRPFVTACNSGFRRERPWAADPSKPFRRGI